MRPGRTRVSGRDIYLRVGTRTLIIRLEIEYYPSLARILEIRMIRLGKGSLWYNYGPRLGVWLTSKVLRVRLVTVQVCWYLSSKRPAPGHSPEHERCCVPRWLVTTLAVITCKSASAARSPGRPGVPRSLASLLEPPWRRRWLANSGSCQPGTMP